MGLTNSKNIHQQSVTPTLAENQIFVERGDTVVQLALRHDVPTSHVQTPSGELPNPYRLYPGQVLQIVPRAAQNPPTHSIVAGETLPKIAQQYRMCPIKIVDANPGVDWNPWSFVPGQVLHVPDKRVDELCECCKLSQTR